MNFVKNTSNLVSQLEYEKVIGYLMYLITCIMPDIAYAIGKISRYTSNPNHMQWHEVIKILRYLKKTQDYGIIY